MASWEIRPAAEVPQRALIELVRRYLEEVVSADPACRLRLGTGSTAATVIQQALGARGTYFAVACVAGEPVGFVIASRWRPYGVLARVEYAHISDLYLDPPHRTPDRMEALLGAVADWGRAQGLSGLTASVPAHSPSLSLLRGAGFGEYRVTLLRSLEAPDGVPSGLPALTGRGDAG